MADSSFPPSRLALSHQQSGLQETTSRKTRAGTNHCRAISVLYPIPRETIVSKTASPGQGSA